MFIRSIQHKYVRYVLTSIRTILDHLYTTYAKIFSVDLQENNAVFCTPYDINQPIGTLFDRVKTAEITPPPATPHTDQNKSLASHYNLCTRTAFL